MRAIDQLTADLQRPRRRLLDHAVYRYLDTPAALRIFMEHHVFAVWDFMSLLTRLQQDVTCVSLPWVPSTAPPELRRFVNDIKLGEECDSDGTDGYLSHFELYVDAMRELGADPEPALKLVRQVREDGYGYLDAAPPAAAEFVRSTLQVVSHGSTAEVAAAFALGREQLIPDLFRPILQRLGGGETLRYYLDRHVELDEGEHGPMALQLVEFYATHSTDGWQLARAAALDAIRARRRLWDGVLRAIGDARLPSTS